MLKLKNRLRVEKVRSAISTPLVFATGIEQRVWVSGSLKRVGALVACSYFLGYNFDSDTTKLTGRAGEVGVDKFLA